MAWIGLFFENRMVVFAFRLWAGKRFVFRWLPEASFFRAGGGVGCTGGFGGNDAGSTHRGERSADSRGPIAAAAGDWVVASGTGGHRRATQVRRGTGTTS